MTIESLQCNHCGGPLDVPDKARFIKCGHCGSQLEVKREATISYTEVLQKIESAHAEVIEKIDTSNNAVRSELVKIRKQNDYEALDREMEARREELMIKDKEGRVREPSAIGGYLLRIVAIVPVIGGFIVAGSSRPTIFGGSSVPGPLAILIGIGIGIVFFVAGSVQLSKARAMEDLEAEYSRRRSEIEQD